MPLKTLYQLVFLAGILKLLRLHKGAAKVMQNRMVLNFRKSFKKALWTARR